MHSRACTVCPVLFPQSELCTRVLHSRERQLSSREVRTSQINRQSGPVHHCLQEEVWVQWWPTDIAIGKARGNQVILRKPLAQGIITSLTCRLRSHCPGTSSTGANGRLGVSRSQDTSTSPTLEQLPFRSAPTMVPWLCLHNLVTAFSSSKGRQWPAGCPKVLLLPFPLPASHWAS